MKNFQEILTVTELNSLVKVVIEENFRFIIVIGEISNFKTHKPSGNLYFTLKDENSQINVVMWSNRAETLFFSPEDGMQVIIKGRITLYQGRGTYQIEAWEIRPAGMGELQLKFEKLKQKLYEEGLFEESHKKELPEFPETIALITSETGAVLHDFVKITKRRYPLLNIYIYPVKVQGLGAAVEIIEGLKYFQKENKTGRIKTDIIVIARGGGSSEDLQAFNDEQLAREIYACNIPVVSAVGHEVDFTICDFVADKRAPTPSAAAELITPDIKDLIEKIDKISYFCRTFVQKRLSDYRNILESFYSNYFLNRPKDLILNFRLNLDMLTKEICDTVNRKIEKYKDKVCHYNKTLYHINPDNTLKKGFAIVYKSNDSELFTEFTKLVTRASHLRENEEIEITFHDSKKRAVTR
ncbi:MAG: exodeoxyribonuclease VII large subunit [Ignavibacteria bacterium]|nr:exodeoxyribonuclease VII large subunit [Ignavibacteria bacterium]